MSEKNLKFGEEKVQRKSIYKPLFDVVVEFTKGETNTWKIYRNVEKLMRQLFGGESYEVEIRTHDDVKGTVETKRETIEIEKSE
jgi:hypothetical protein